MFPPNPRDVPFQFVDTAGRTLPEELLNTSSLREICLGLPYWSPELRGELPLEGGPLIPSAVLIGLVMRSAPSVLLTRRALHLSDHPGQISFPGGRVADADADSSDTALREAHEEVGLPPENVRVLGHLPAYTTGTGFAITPVVGLVESDFEPRVDSSEVAEMFEVPLSWIMTPANHRRHEVEVLGRRRSFWSMHWPGKGSAEPEGYFIWGATAAILRNLYCFLSTAAP